MDSLETNITNNFFFQGLCHEPLWDVSKSWNTFDLHFGRCMERTVLVWTPCLLLWVCSLFYALALKRRPYNPIPWSAVSHTKVMVTIVLLVAAGAELVWAAVDSSGEVMTADYLAPSLLLLTHTLYLGLVLLGRRRGERSSGLLWLYWLLVLVCGVPQLSTAITTTIRGDRQLPAIQVATFLLHYLGSLALFLANCVSDDPSRLETLTRTQKPSPELDASFPNRLFYAYALPLIWHGWRRPLTSHDLSDANPRNSAEAVYSKWQQSINRGKNFTSQQELKFEAFPEKSESATCPPQVQQVALVKQIWRLSRFSFTVALCTAVTYEIIQYAVPFILSLLINFMMDASQPTWHGYFYAVCVLVICEVVSLSKNVHYQRTFTLSFTIRTMLMAAVYKKALRLSGSARRKFTVGQIVNLMAVDSQVIGDLFRFLSFLFVTPILIVLTISLVWQKLAFSRCAEGSFSNHPHQSNPPCPHG